jgi:hypothetical protein
MKRRAIVLLSVVLLMWLLAVPSAAGHWIQAEGTMTSAFDPADRTATDIHGKCLIEIEPYQRFFEGTLIGESAEHLTVLSQGPCEGIYPGKYDDRFWFRGTFEGQIEGRAGTCRYVGAARTWAGSPPVMKIRMRLFACTGELAGTTGVLRFGWEDPYWGWVHLAGED